MSQHKNEQEYTFEELINDQGYILFTNSGISMMPLLRQQKDVIEIHKKTGRVKKYDVVLYKNGDEYILHRCIAVRPTGYVFSGDHNTYKEYDVTDEMILGVMTKVIRDGREIYPTSFLYRVYSHLWVDLFPIKVFLLKSKVLFHRLGKVTPSKIRSYLNWKIVQGIDLFYDLRIAGKNLTEDASIHSPSSRQVSFYRSTHYLILKKVFSHVHINPSDSFLDIGCGKGRTLSFLISQHCVCQLHGIEADNKLRKVAEEWTKKYENVHVTAQHLFEVDYNQYTIVFLNQSFFSNTFLEFIQLLEKQVSHPIRIICLYDRASESCLNAREGWSMQYCEDFFKLYGLQVVGTAKKFSLWKYTPVKDEIERKNHAASNRDFRNMIQQILG